MYQKVLVPLDGSPLAECVLSHLETLAKGCALKEVDLVRVIEPFRAPYSGEEGFIDDRQIQRMEAANHAEARQYLKDLAAKTQYEGVNIQWHTLEGRPADAIADHAVKNGVDLILIATHGRSGVSRWIWGSVADQVLRSACVPVLLVRAPGCVPGITPSA